MIDISQLIIPVAHAQEAAAPAGGIATLGLNVKFFIAQLINFGILLLIFWKWILPNVTKALQDRTQRIHRSLLEAERIDKDKKNFEVWKNEQIINARHEANTIVTKAQADTTKIREEALRKTTEDQQKLVEQAKKQIQDEKAQALQSAKGELADLVTNATEKIIRHKLTKEKDEELIKDMLKSLWFSLLNTKEY